jgi:phosphoglycolate phosphatase-like HAD superfamily hydrolase
VLAILFDIDGTLITTGGAGAAAWRMAFEELYGIPADIGMFSDAGMTDPEVGRLTFKNVIGHEPTSRELSRVMARRLAHLPQAVADSEGYRVLDGVAELLPRLVEEGYLLGLTTGGVEAAAHIKLQRGGLGHYFCFGGYGSDSPDRVELTRAGVKRAEAIVGEPISRERVLVLGDTPLDISAAHGAGATAVGVASGHFTSDQLQEAGGDYVLGSLTEPLPLGSSK